MGSQSHASVKTRSCHKVGIRVFGHFGLFLVVFWWKTWFWWYFGVSQCNPPKSLADLISKLLIARPARSRRFWMARPTRVQNSTRSGGSGNQNFGDTGPPTILVGCTGVPQNISKIMHFHQKPPKTTQNDQKTRFPTLWHDLVFTGAWPSSPTPFFRR